MLAVPVEEVASVTDHADQILGEILQTGYACNADGFDRHNRGNWCDLGCGSDYNRMIPVTVIKTTALDSLLARLREAEQRAERAKEALGWFDFIEDVELGGADDSSLSVTVMRSVAGWRKARNLYRAALSQATPEGDQ